MIAYKMINIYTKICVGLSTRAFKMLIKNIENIFWLIKISYNIVSGIYFPVLTNPSYINDPPVFRGIFLLYSFNIA